MPLQGSTQEAHLSGPCQDQKSSPAHREQGADTPTCEVPLVQSPGTEDLPSLCIYSPQYSLGRYSAGEGGLI